MKVILIGHLKKLFKRNEIVLQEDIQDISELLNHLDKLKNNTKVTVNRENTLIFVNEVEISALEDLRTKLKGNDIITLVPVTHGG